MERKSSKKTPAITTDTQNMNRKKDDPVQTQDDLLQQYLNNPASHDLTPEVARSLQQTHGNHFVLQRLREQQAPHLPSPVRLSMSPSTPHLQRLKDDDVFQAVENQGGEIVQKRGDELPDRLFVVTDAGFPYIHKSEINDGGQTYKKVGQDVEMKGICFFKPEKEEMFRILNLFYPSDDEESSSGSDSNNEGLAENSGDEAVTEFFSDPNLLNFDQNGAGFDEDDPIMGEGGDDDSVSDDDSVEALAPAGKQGEPKLKKDSSVYYDEVIGQAFIGEPKSTDVDQGIGNCYFMATLASLIDNPAGQQLLTEMIVPFDDNKKYRVKLAKIREGENEQAVELDGEVEITAWFPIRFDQFAYALSLKKRADAIKEGATVALWPVIMEKAYAIHKERRAALKSALKGGALEDTNNILEQTKGDYQMLEGGFADAALTDLGVQSTVFNPQGKQPDEVKTWLTDHNDKPRVAGTAPRGGWTSYWQSIPFVQQDENLFHKHVAAYEKENFEIKYDNRVLTVTDAGGIFDNQQAVGSVNFDAGEILITQPESYPDHANFKLTFQEKYDETDADKIMPKHAYMVKGIADDVVTLYDTFSRQERTVTVLQVTKYFNSLVAGNIGQ